MVKFPAYCISIHQPETWYDVLRVIENNARKVKNAVCPDTPMSLGLRLSNEASIPCLQNVEVLKDVLSRNGFYVETVNCFPYGVFHGRPVKESVYLPDWGSNERVEYTIRSAKILSTILNGNTGSISTVPVGYGKKIPSNALTNIKEVLKFCRSLFESVGKKIIIAFEPEPDCFLDSCNDVLNFWNMLKLNCPDILMNHAGICLDMCHSYCDFEDPADVYTIFKENEINVAKLQISSSLIVPAGNNAKQILTPFKDAVYLHQTRIMNNQSIQLFPDLDNAIEYGTDGEWRVHYHVPLYFKGDGALTSTMHLVDPAFIRNCLLDNIHCEIETYSYPVMPSVEHDAETSTIMEYRYLERLLNCE